MDKYKIHNSVGDGTFGSVFKATNTQTGEIVAIKKMKKKFYSWDECMSLRELKSLRKLVHPNITKLKEVLKVNDELHFVFEFLDQNIYQMYTQARDRGVPLPDDKIKSVMHQLLSGLSYMHKHGFFHRDLKPENLLITKDIVKLGDFGLAREVRSRPPYTEYVSTRWYRAPEILLRSNTYNSPVDIFACGCIMAELYMQAPLFNGNSEVDQMYKICSVLGTPTHNSWSEGFRLASNIGYNFPQFAPTSLSTLIPSASEDAISLILEMLRYDPNKRPSAHQILQHSYFNGFTPMERAPSPKLNDNGRAKQTDMVKAPPSVPTQLNIKRQDSDLFKALIEKAESPEVKDDAKTDSVTRVPEPKEPEIKKIVSTLAMPMEPRKRVSLIAKVPAERISSPKPNDIGKVKLNDINKMTGPLNLQNNLKKRDSGLFKIPGDRIASPKPTEIGRTKLSDLGKPPLTLQNNLKKKEPELFKEYGIEDNDKISPTTQKIKELQDCIQSIAKIDPPTNTAAVVPAIKDELPRRRREIGETRGREPTNPVYSLDRNLDSGLDVRRKVVTETSAGNLSFQPTSLAQPNLYSRNNSIGLPSLDGGLAGKHRQINPTIQGGMINARTAQKTIIQKYHLPKLDSPGQEAHKVDKSNLSSAEKNSRNVIPSAYDFIAAPKPFTLEKISAGSSRNRSQNASSRVTKDILGLDYGFAQRDPNQLNIVNPPMKLNLIRKDELKINLDRALKGEVSIRGSYNKDSDILDKFMY